MFVDIKKIINKNREVLLLIASVVILLSVFGYLYLKDRSNSETKTVYPVNLDTTQEVLHNWDSVNMTGSIEDDVDLLDVFSVESIGIKRVRDLVRDLGYDMGSEVLSDSGRFYTWSNERNSAQYDSVTMKFSAVTSGVRLGKLSPRSLNQDSVIEYFNEFLSEYVGIGQDFRVGVEKKGDVYEIRGTWLVDEFPVFGPYNEEDLILVQFNDIGTLLSISISLTQFTMSNELVNLVSVPDMLSYIRARSYPKEVFLTQQVGSDQGCSDEGCIDFEISSLDGFIEATIDDVRIVYLCDPYSSQDVLPIFLLRGNALILDENDMPISAEVTIYANAVDLSQISIPQKE